MSAPLWIFGYGSLVWRPAFDFIEQCPAVVLDWRRRFWQASPDHRGTPERPGRVVTMLRWPGQACWGMAYRLDPAQQESTLAALDAREVAGYQRQEVSLRASSGEAPFGEGLTWVAPASNPNFLGIASPERMVDQIRGAQGDSGSNLEYVLRLAEALRGLGAEDTELFELDALLRQS